jgi:regulatory protein
MKITGVTAQVKNQNRLNVMVDGVYRFSLDMFQYADLGIRIGREYSEDELVALETESQFGKVYARALEYCMMRPHSTKEVRDYLYRKTRDTRTKTGELRSGISSEIAGRVLERLLEKGYVNDDNFTTYWIENRQLTKGASRRKLVAELRAKGVDQSVIDRFMAATTRSDDDELRKVLQKKRARYPDDQKLIQYLARQGFGFDDIKQAMAESDAL